jgi:imidazolonepropionase-like amidohydrolase/Tol biopolymer transport system component
MKQTTTAAVLAAFLLGSGAAPVFANDDANKDESPKWDVNNPPGKFVDAAIDVREGTWMNLDVSPDGKTIVFDLLGDLYTMPITGGEATALTQDIAWQMQPRFSPNGKQIAFTSDQGGGDNIWIMDVDGSNASAVSKETFRLLNSPAWSPDGDYLVARKHFTGARSLGAGEVWLYHKSGGQGLMLTKRPNEQKDLGEPAFSPDGEYIYFSQDATPGKTFHYSKDSEQGIYKIKRLNRETGEIKVLIEGRGGAIRPTPSPDGKQLAYIARDDFQTSLYVMDLQSGSKRKLYDRLERDMQETWAIHGVYPTMAWTPDNKSLLFWAAGKIHRLNVEDSAVSEIPFHVKTSKKIQKTVRNKQQHLGADTFDTNMLRNVQVSPDGRLVVFEALGHLYTRALPDGKARRLTRQNEHFELQPAFSRDGKSIVYASWNDQDQGAIRIVSTRGGSGKAITNEPGKYVEPQFSPDGKTVVFRKFSGGYITDPAWGLKPGIYTVGRKGGEARWLSDAGVQPHFGASNEVVYVTIAGEKQALTSIDVKTRKQRERYSSELATEYRVSPDGRTLAFSERFKIFITPFTELGDSISTGPKGGSLPVTQLSVRAGENISWNANSDQLYWSLGSDLYQMPVDRHFASSTDDGKKTEPKITAIGFAQQADKPQGLVAFVGGKVVTMEGNKVIDNGVVLVENNRIKAVGARDEVSIPADAKQIDISGKSILPGLIDAHAHGPQGSDEIIPQQNWKNYAGLSLGVTTIHDPSHDTTEFFAASEMQKAGRIVGPRLYSTGAILYGAKIAGYTSHVDSLEDAKFHLLRQKKAGAFSVKSYNQPRRDQRQQVIEAARQLDMMVVPEGGSLLQHNLTMLVDGHTTLEHSIPAANVYADIKQLWKASDMAYTPTLVVAYGGIWGEHYWYDKTDVWQHPRLSRFVPSDILAPRSMRRNKAPDHHYNHVSVAKTAKLLNDQGVLTNIGAHGQREGLGAHWELWMYAQGGMSPLQALKTATINPAITLGLDHELGTLAAGKLADMIVVDGDITADIRISDRVQYVMLNGRLYDAASMNEVGNYNKPRQPFYFEK